jgi:hypothetical protein
MMVLRSAAERQPTRLVGAGLALPLSFPRGVERGQGKPSPYETLIRKRKSSENRRWKLEC